MATYGARVLSFRVVVVFKLTHHPHAFLPWEIDEERPLIDAFVVDGFGVRVGVQVDEAFLIPLMTARLPPRARLSVSRAVDAIVPIVAAGIAPPAGGESMSEALSALLDEFEARLRFAIAQFSRREIFVHAAVVGWKGATVLLPARTHGGKSHLTAALIKAGATYFSDEHAILDVSGRVHPWLKPLSLREGGSRQREAPPAEFGARIAKKPARVALILVTRYDADASWNPTRLSPSEGALALMSNAFGARLWPDRAMSVLARVARTAAIYRTDRPDAELVVPKILEMLERAAPTSGAEDLLK